MGDKARSPSEVEPVFYSSYPPEVMTALRTRLFANCVVSLTPAGGRDAADCVVNRVKYFAFCFTAAHKAQIWFQIKQEVLKSMVEPRGANHDAEIAQAFGSIVVGKPQAAPKKTKGQTRSVVEEAGGSEGVNPNKGKSSSSGKKPAAKAQPKAKKKRGTPAAASAVDGDISPLGDDAEVSSWDSSDDDE